MFFKNIKTKFSLFYINHIMLKTKTSNYSIKYVIFNCPKTQANDKDVELSAYGLQFGCYDLNTWKKTSLLIWVKSCKDVAFWGKQIFRIMLLSVSKCWYLSIIAKIFIRCYYMWKIKYNVYINIESKIFSFPINLPYWKWSTDSHSHSFHLLIKKITNLICSKIYSFFIRSITLDHQGWLRLRLQEIKTYFYYLCFITLYFQFCITKLCLQNFSSTHLLLKS